MRTERGGRQRPELWPNRRPQPRASSCIATSRRSGIDGCDGADYRRVWSGQGTARERDSRTWTTVTATVCAGQLQRHPARHVRERVLRPRARRVHGGRGAIGSGRFQIADGGTIFLDEIGDLPASCSPSYCGCCRKVSTSASARSVTREDRCSRDCRHEPESGRRGPRTPLSAGSVLSVKRVPTGVRPLRARTGDIPLLATHAITEVSKRLKMQAPPLTQSGRRTAPTVRLAEATSGNCRT